MGKQNKGQRGYASAPYNFIPFYNKVFEAYASMEELPLHNKFCEGTKSGYIDYKIKTETPISINDGDGEFFKVNNKYVIPGSTVRGKIRSNAEIITCSQPEFIQDKKFWFRGSFAVADDPRKKLYNDELLPNYNSRISDKVKAGYLTKRRQKYYIIPCEEDDNGISYRDIHESKLRKIHLNRNIGIKENMFMYNNEYTEGKSLWDHITEAKNKRKTLKKELEKLEKKRKESNIECVVNHKELQEQINTKNINIKDQQRIIKDLLNRNKKKQYKNYVYKVKYRIDGESNEPIIEQVSEIKDDTNVGYLMNSDNCSQKQNHYLIFKENLSGKEKLIQTSVMNAYKTSIQNSHYKDQENIAKEGYEKLKDNERQPVFYILGEDEDNEILVFGFTPYMKIPYKKSICDLINVDKNDLNKIDFVKSVFGFTNINNKSYKGRVSFTNAILENKSVQMGETNKYLMSPRPTSFQLYLSQGENKLEKLRTYTEGSTLRGRKFYWLKTQCDNNDQNKNNQNKNDNKEQLAKIKALDIGQIFGGRVYFKNMYDYELALLLMSIKPCDQAKDNIGQGKPYGYGKINFSIESVVAEDMDKKFGEFFINKNDISKVIDNISNKEKQIKFFENEMGKIKKNPLGKIKENFIKDIITYIKSDEYEQFIYSKTTERKSSEFNYMDFEDDKNKYKRRYPLKDVKQYKDKDSRLDEAAIDNYTNNGYGNEELKKMISSKFRVGKL